MALYLKLLIILVSMILIYSKEKDFNEQSFKTIMLGDTLNIDNNTYEFQNTNETIAPELISDLDNNT